MRFLYTLLTASMFAASTWAMPNLPITFQDELASQNPSDVIGDPNLFDIDYLSLTNPLNGTMQVDIRFNYGGGASLSAFTIGGFAPALNVGDFFITTGANTYAYILNSHNGLVTNGLYQISGTQTSATVLGNPAGTYRGSAPVWASPTGAQLLATGTSSIGTVNGNTTNLLASLYLPLTANMLADLSNGFDIYFASATCGNDEITGTVPATGVPEPGTWAMLSAGLLLIGLSRRKL